MGTLVPDGFVIELVGLDMAVTTKVPLVEIVMERALGDCNPRVGLIFGNVGVRVELAPGDCNSEPDLAFDIVVVVLKTVLSPIVVDVA